MLSMLSAVPASHIPSHEDNYQEEYYAFVYSRSDKYTLTGLPSSSLGDCLIPIINCLVHSILLTVVVFWIRGNLHHSLYSELQGLWVKELDSSPGIIHIFQVRRFSGTD